MKQKEYIAAIKKQKSLIRKLFSSRRRRSKVVQELTDERYKHLTGRFFRPSGDKFRNIYDDKDYYICSVSTESDYVMSDEVYLSLDCRCVGCTYRGTDMTVVGIEISNQSFRFSPADDLDELLADKWVDEAKALNAIDEYYRQFISNLLKKK